MSTTTCRWFSALVLLLLAGLALAQEPRRFGVPGHGNLVLNVPAGWRVIDSSVAQPPSAIIRMRPPEGDRFYLQVTAIRLDPAKIAEITPEVIRERMRNVAKKVFTSAVESDVQLVDLRGNQAYGSHFSVTDAKSKNTAGDYKYVTQGFIVSGELITNFTFLHREQPEPDRERVLQMFADAIHAKDEPSAGPAIRPDALQVTESGSSFVLSVPISRLVMTIPSAGMTRMPSFAGGASSHPRYFNFNAGTLNLSGWFEPAGGYKGIQDFWANESAGWKRRGIGEPSGVEFSKEQGWDVVLYEMSAPAGVTMPAGAVNTHLRAHWVQSGTWIDLHLSTIGRTTAAENRATLLAMLRTIAVTEKPK